MQKVDKTSNSTQQLMINEAFPSKDMIYKKSNQNILAPSKRISQLMLSESELERMTDQMVNKCGSMRSINEIQENAYRVGSAMSSISHNDSAGKHMILRKRSQGLEKSSLKKSYQSKIGNGKVVADYLPLIKSAQKQVDDDTRLSGRENNRSLEPSIRAVRTYNTMVKRELRQTCQIQQVTKFDLSNVEKKSNDEPDSPTENDQENDNDALNDDDESSDDQDDSDDSEEDPQEQEKKAKEIREIQDWARANGFQVAIEQPEKEQTQQNDRKLSKRKDNQPQADSKDESPIKQTQGNKQPTSNKKKFDYNTEGDWLGNWQSLSIDKDMEHFIPPPCDIMERQYTDSEPIRTGFNQGLIPISIRDNCERAHYPQGPQIVVTTQNVYKKKETYCERRERMRKRTQSKDIPSILRKSTFKEPSCPSEDLSVKIDQIKSVQNSAERLKESDIGPDELTKDENDKDQVQKVIHQAMMNSETSLRHLFYLEYKKSFTDGNQNPIVFSKFGKKFYGSDEKFDPNNFQQLIRTCNLKRLFKANSQLAQLKGDKKFTDEVSYPSGNYYRPLDSNDKTLVFESRFESGNLQMVHKKSEAEYDLVLQNDINSKGHTQWFYFRVTNVKKGQRVKFNMLNMIKSKSLFTEGMKVMYYSEQRQENPKKTPEEKGWSRGGEEYSYYQNNYRKENQTLGQQRCYFTFTFTFTFDYDEDVVYFAYGQPYTYTDLVTDLNEIQQRKLNYVSRNTLCRTIAGNKCEYLTISNRVPVEMDRKKKGVIITARIHPGESNSSWMMKGVIDFLISDSPQAIELRNKFIFKVVPMLNPDGVINGNYRCSLAGCDLNRRWKYPSEVLHPTIYHTKKLIARLAKDRTLALYCDLHGHSRRKNVFFYGNSLSENPEATRVFPFLMSKLAQPNFSYDYSKFAVCRTKEHTARIAMWRDLGGKTPNIFTLEASFCGPKAVRLEPHREKQPFAAELNYHFNTEDLTQVGHNLCETLLLYSAAEQSPNGIQKIEHQVQQFQIQKQNMLELDEIIKQQQKEDEKKLLYGTVSQSRTNDFQVQTSSTKEKTSSIVVKDFKDPHEQPRDASNTRSTKKVAPKAKIDKTATMLVEFCKKGKLDRPMDKKKVKYNTKEGDNSEAESDSEPSDDNLDQNEIMKLIPKKFGKAKYLKGLMEKKKTVVIEEKKEVKKKPKATLMPCMSSSKKEREKQAMIKDQPTKKPYVQKTVVSVLRKGGVQRDVGTQIPYTSEGKNLSLMELDILAVTGCKWSKIIYPGFRGVRPNNRESFISADRLMQDCFIRNGSEQRPSLTTPTKQNNYISKAFESTSNRKSNISEIDQNQSSSLLKSVLSSSMGQARNVTPKKLQKVSPFMNEVIKQASHANEKSLDGVLNSLQKRIQDASFVEPRSLFGGKSLVGSNEYSIFLNNEKNNSSIKKRGLMGLPSYELQKKSLIQKFDLKNLETVQEKINPLTTINQYERGSLERKKRQSSIITPGSMITKKVINGEIVKQSIGQMLPRVVDQKQQLSAHKQRNKSLNSQGGITASGQKGIDARTSFKHVAHHMLNESQSQSNYDKKFLKFDTSDLKKIDVAPNSKKNQNGTGAHAPTINKMNVKLLRQAFVNQNDQY